MFLSRALFMAPRLQQQQRMSSGRKLAYHWRPRSSITTDQRRPPLLLVKSFYYLRHKDTDYGKDVSRVTDELSFPPHRIIFIEILQHQSQRPIEMKGIADGETKDSELPDSNPFPVAVPIKDQKS